jgi:hypothetical protein
MWTRMMSVIMATTLTGVLSTHTWARGDAPPPGPASGTAVKNIVLVHGACVDASGWKSVYEILSRDGYNVTMVQEPLTSLGA